MKPEDVGWGRAAVMKKGNKSFYVQSFGNVQLHGAEGNKKGLTPIKNNVARTTGRAPTRGDPVGDEEWTGSSTTGSSKEDEDEDEDVDVTSKKSEKDEDEEEEDSLISCRESTL